VSTEKQQIQPLEKLVPEIVVNLYRSSMKAVGEPENAVAIDLTKY
jgi:hypothetical protein